MRVLNSTNKEVQLPVLLDYGFGFTCPIGTLHFKQIGHDTFMLFNDKSHNRWTSRVFNRNEDILSFLNNTFPGWKQCD